MTNPTNKRWLKAEEAAELLRVSKSAAYRYAEAGIIPAARIGGILRIDREGLEELMEKQARARVRARAESQAQAEAK